MQLTKEQLRKFGKKFINQLREEVKNDKPFGTDEWPYELAHISGYVHDEENMSEPPDWQDVDQVFNQLFDIFDKAL